MDTTGFSASHASIMNPSRAKRMSKCLQVHEIIDRILNFLT